MPLAGRPFLTFMLDWARAHGVDEVILSCGFMSDDVKRGARRHLRRHAAALRDRGGAARHRRPRAPGVRRGAARGAPVRAERRRAHRHRPHRGAGAARAQGARARRSRCIAVEDTSSYGVVPTDDDGAVRGVHREGRRRAAHEPDQRGRVRDRARRRGDVDPGRPGGVVRARGVPVAGRGTACTASRRPATGSTSGRPSATSRPTWDLLAGRVASTLPPRDETGSLVYENCLLSGAHVGPQSVLGRHCSVGTDARVERSVLHDRVHVGADATIVESVLAERVRVGERAQVGPAARWWERGP